MTPRAVLVIEVADAGGHGHRFLVPEGIHVTEGEAVSLTSSIRECVHVSADRIGVSRTVHQRTTMGTQRDATMVVVVAGIDVLSTAPDLVIAALATLERCLDAAVAEASATGSPAHMVIPSRAATATLDTIQQLGFHRRSSIAQASSSKLDTPRPHPASPFPGWAGELALFAGSLAVLACGIGIGWFVARSNGTRAAVPAPAMTMNGRTNRLETSESAGVDMAQTIEDPALEPASVGEPEAESLQRPTTLQRSDDPDDGRRRDEVPGHDAPEGPLAPAPRTAEPLSMRSGFRIECFNAVPGDQFQLYLTESGKGLGATLTANGQECTFEGPATEGITSPQQLGVEFTPPRKPWSTRPPQQRQHLKVLEGKGSCSFDVTTASDQFERTVHVRVSPRQVSTEAWHLLPPPPAP